MQKPIFNIHDYNNRKSPPAILLREAFRKKTPSHRDLEDVFRLETKRVDGQRLVVRYQNRLLRVQKMKRHSAPAQAQVTVCEWEDRRLEIRYRGQVLDWKEIADRPREAVVEVDNSEPLHLTNPIIMSMLE